VHKEWKISKEIIEKLQERLVADIESLRNNQRLEEEMMSLSLKHKFRRMKSRLSDLNEETKKSATQTQALVDSLRIVLTSIKPLFTII